MSRRSVIFIVLSVILVYLYQGYTWGRSDQAEIISLAQFMDNPSWYLQDLYVSTMVANEMNERLAITSLIHLVYNSPWVAFVLHFICTSFLVSGLFFLTKKIVPRDLSAFVVVWIVLVVLSSINLGGNEIYYNFLIGSVVAKALAIWTILMLLEKRWWLTSILLLTSCLFQMVVGLQIWIMVSCWAFHRLVNKKEIIWPLWAGLFVTILVCLPFITANSGDLSNVDFFEITEFRNAHHYFPAYFPWKGWIVYIGLFICTIYFILRWGLNDFFMVLVGTSVLGLLLYYLNLRFQFSSLILSSQWFKTTIWLEWIGVASFVFIFEMLLDDTIREVKTSVIISVIFVMTLVGADFKAWDINGTSINTDELRLASDLSDEEIETILVPPSFIAYKPLVHKSSPVEYKSFLHNKDDMAKWYDRIQSYMGLSIANRRNRDDFDKVAGEYMSTHLEYYQEAGIDCVIVPREFLTAGDYEILSETTDFVAVRP